MKITNKIKTVPTILVENKEEVNKYFNELIEKGFEGAIIRNINSKYRMGKQSQDIQKIKLYFMLIFVLLLSLTILLIEFRNVLMVLKKFDGFE